MPVSERGSPFDDGRPLVAPITLSRVVLFALRHRWLVLVFPVVLTVALVVSALFRPRTWTSGAAFVPQSAAAATSNLSGLAAQFGVNLGASSDAQGPLFYAELLRSREILLPVVDASYVVETDTGTFRGSLTTWFGAGGDTPQARSELAKRWLDEALMTNTGLKTGIVRYAVRTTSPQLSYQVASGLLARLNEFNLTGRQSRASQERKFAEQRLLEARSALRSIEDRLAAFLSRNRAYSSTNALSFEEERLRRDIAFRAQVVSTLSEAYERARLDEVRDIPTITVLEQPASPARPDSRGALKLLLMSLLTTGALGVMLALGIDALRSLRRSAAEDSEWADRPAGWRLRRGSSVPS